MKLIVMILPFQVGVDQNREFEWDAPTTSIDEALGLVFREFNVVNEGDPHIARRCRSMSVGDVVKVQDRYFVCSHVGWKEVADIDVERYKKMDFKDRDMALYERRLKPGMIPCTVTYEHTSYNVQFENGKSLFLQSDWDQAAFAVSCGLIKAPDNWDGVPSKLGKAWEDCELSDITACPDDYLEQAK